jgi:hypothetical protein
MGFFTVMTKEEELELSELVDKYERETVSPKLEQFRKPAWIKACCGGRGAGAKSVSIASLLVQKMERGEIRKWLCGREIQETLEESSFSLIWETVERLKYIGWRQVPTSSKIINEKTGGYFKFTGFKDIKTAKGKKSLQGYDGCWIEECEDIKEDIWDVILPTFRKTGCEIWASFNRNKEMDPVYKMFFVNSPPDTIAIELLPGKIDNPWFPDILQKQLEHDYLTRPDVAEHKWGGKPKAQGDNCVFTRSAIRAAMNRKGEASGGQGLGVDVARFGADNSELWYHHGPVVTAHRTIRGQDTIAVATAAWEMVCKDPSIPIKVDDGGVGGGVSDQLKHWGAKVIRVNFGGKPSQPDKYADLATEMWFEFPLDEVCLPDDEELMDELSERRYDYDKNEVKRIEAKKDFKPRIGRSPDKADALLLSFYTGKTIEYDEETRRALLARRNR